LNDTHAMPERALVVTDFQLFPVAGRDILILGTLACGGAGTVASSANIVPRLVVEIYDKFTAGDLAGALEAQYRLAPMRMAYSLGSFPVVTKDYMRLLGFDVGEPIRPNTRSNSKNMEKLKQLLDDLGRNDSPEGNIQSRKGRCKDENRICRTRNHGQTHEQESAQGGLRARGDEQEPGGEPKVIDGTLSVMVGGKKAVFDKCFDIMKAMAGSVVLTGDVGAGNITKLANQIIVALNIAAMSEALVLATKAGVAPELVYPAIRGGLAGSTVLDATPLVLDRKFDHGFRINLLVKDLGNVLETSHEIGVPLPLTAAVMEMMQAMKVDGMGDLDHGALVRHCEKLAQVEVKR
jgi:hypothetical protein